MARKTQTKTTTTETTSKAAAQQPRRRRNRKKEDAPAEEPAPETVAETTAEETTTRRRRSAPTRDEVLAELDQLVADIEAQITANRETPGKGKGTKFLRSLGKRVKTVRSRAARVMRQRNSTTRRNNNNSGFQKPVRISEEMARFAGWDPEERRSRVDVTRYLCDYIKKHDLQNPDDKRNIRVENDKKFSKLLRYDRKDGKPMNYFRLQGAIKHHFLADEE